MLHTYRNLQQAFLLQFASLFTFISATTWDLRDEIIWPGD
jgi:hypothetical protein